MKKKQRKALLWVDKKQTERDPFAGWFCETLCRLQVVPQFCLQRALLWSSLIGLVLLLLVEGGWQGILQSLNRGRKRSGMPAHRLVFRAVAWTANKPLISLPPNLVFVLNM
jgi:hypothetical protein